MEINSLLENKGLYRFTGPPEHWLTAVKYMTWGLEEKLKKTWSQLKSGDVFFIHSTQNSYFKNARSGIIGLGVIGPNFSIKKSPLWLYETENKVNRWPLLVPLSEIYLFSSLPSRDIWENPSKSNIEATKSLIDSILRNFIPLGRIIGFPQMGSFSSVRLEVAKQILNDKRPLYLFSASQDFDESRLTKKANIQTHVGKTFEEVKSVKEAIRYADTLEIFDVVKNRVFKEPTSQYTRDNELLDLANQTHQTILQQLIDLFQNKGYVTRNSKGVDLFAHNKNRAFLFEVKSTENRNFRRQVRGGIGQLFEYEYFDVQRFAEDNNLVFQEKHKLIIPSKKPEDMNYVSFINSLKIGMALVEEDGLKPVGKDFGFSKL